MDLERMFAVANAVKACFDLTDDLDELMSVIGCSLDFWAADHGVSAENLESALKALLDASVSAHAVLGMPTQYK